jgi:hypothetical protein
VTPEDKKLRLDNFLILHQPWSNDRPRYDTIILPLESARQFLELCRIFEIRMDVVEFWCNCNHRTAAQRGCPHGGGGHPYGENGSYFSDLYHLTPWFSEKYCGNRDFSDEFQSMLDYIDQAWERSGRLPCFSLGLFPLLQSIY